MFEWPPLWTAPWRSVREEAEPRGLDFALLWPESKTTNQTRLLPQLRCGKRG